MKQMKSTVIVLVLCALCAGATAQTVTVADVEALPGETVAFTLNLTSGKANTYTAMQFDAHFPVTGFTTTGKYIVSELWENATANIGAVVNGVATIPIASSESISAADVEGLLSVSFTVGSDVEIGDYDVTLKNLWFGYGTSSKDSLDDVTFKVNVVSAHTVILNETSTTPPEAAEGVNVKVMRTINKDVWGTICLPFSMSEDQVEAAFGEDVKLADFTGIVSNYDTDEETILSIEVNFSQVTSIESNHPYLIKVGNNISSFTVENVDIDPNEASVDKDEWRTGSGTKKDPYVYHYNSFVGTYVADTTVPELCLFLSGNKLWYSNGNTKMKGFRAYFDFYDVLTEVEEGSSEAPAISLSIATGEVTKIDARTMKELETGRVYNLSGQCLGELEDMNQLPKGIYIVNGKKIVR